MQLTRQGGSTNKRSSALHDGTKGDTSETVNFLRVITELSEGTGLRTEKLADVDKSKCKLFWTPINSIDRMEITNILGNRP